MVKGKRSYHVRKKTTIYGPKGSKQENKLCVHGVLCCVAMNALIPRPRCNSTTFGAANSRSEPLGNHPGL